MHTGRVATWGAQPLQASNRLDVIEHFSLRLAASVEKTLRDGKQTLVLGGEPTPALAA